jgi:protein-S-isoprenylcysteine O-methyltransferase Ste14
MKKPISSKILVLLQFVCIVILLFNSASIFNSSLGLVFAALGFVIACWALIYNDFYNFNITPELKEKGQLIMEGPYKYSRHPMYLALLLIMLGVTLAIHEWVYYLVYVVLFAVLYIKSLKEEYLWGLKSKEYQKYREKTKMFIPFVF